MSQGFSNIADETTDKKLPEQIASKVYIPDLGITELTLKNGMKVVLKPTDFETNEILIRIISSGGYSTLPVDKYPSGVIAAQTAWESGLDNLTSDQLSVLLYKHFIELNVKIHPFSRLIEGSTDSDGLPTVLKLVGMLFMQPHFSKEAFNTVIKETKESLSKRACDRDTNFDDVFKITNTQNYPYLRPLTPELLDKADFSTAKEFFEYSFSDPAKYIAIVVGDFKIEENLNVIAQTLGAIREKQVNFDPPSLSYPKFPRGISNKCIKINSRSDSLVRMTFPLASPLDQMQLQPFEVATEVLESRLREIFRDSFKSSLGISVAYEFPLYPLLYRPWLVIQYRCSPRQVDKVKEIILDEIKKLKQVGPTKTELEKVLSNIKRTDEFWLRENSYWSVTLSNYYIWGWNPVYAVKSFEYIEKLTPQEIKKIITEYIPLDNYTIINFHP